MSEKGLKLLYQMMGKEKADELVAGWAKLSPDFARMITDFVAADVWARPGLELKSRSFITIAALTVLGRMNALRINIEMALNNGATRTEIVEALLHLAPYAGFPACWDALIVADEVFSRKQSAGA